jgi:hypothetical protein
VEILPQIYGFGFNFNFDANQTELGKKHQRRLHQTHEIKLFIPGLTKKNGSTGDTEGLSMKSIFFPGSGSMSVHE